MLVIIGPSACGKTQIVNQLIEKYHFKKLVTYTTRPMRIGEINGVDYHFITTNEFEEKIKQNFFLEYVSYNHNYYGTSFSDLDEDKVVIIEAEGLKKYIEKAKDRIKIVYIRCSKPIRKIRMMNRQDKIANIEERLASDDLVFNTSIEKLADKIIDSSNSNIYDDAKIIYNYYYRKGNNYEN